MTEPPATPGPPEAVEVDSAGVYLDLSPEDLNYGNLEKVEDAGSPERPDER